MRPEPQYLFDILDCADCIEQFLAGKSYDTFATDELLRSAVMMKLFIIGEAVANISEQTQQQYPEVPWFDIRGFRNFVAHQYFKVRWDIIWKSATARVPELVAKVEEILRNEYPGAQPENA